MLGFALIAQAGEPLAVESVRLGGEGDMTRIVIDFNAPPDFRAFLLDGPRRLAVDLPVARWKTLSSRPTGQGLVRGYRSGPLEKDGLTRVVFDLKGPATVASAFVLPPEDGAKNRVVIDLRASSVPLFTARLGTVYGNKGLQAVKAPATPSAKPVQAKPSVDPAPPQMPAPKPLRGGRQMKTIVIDAGHGGHDPGAVAGSIYEKKITLAIAREARRVLEETGRYKVVLTRDADRFLKLRERVRLSREAKGDVFISLHADKIGRKGVHGASVYTLSETASDAETARLAEDENNAGVVAGVDLDEESHDVANILLDLAMREKMTESGVLAKAVVEGLRRKNVGLLPNSHRSAGFAVLKAPDVPAILIEAGFLSNPEEAKLLSSAAFQRKIAEGLRDGIDAYFRKIESLRGPD